MFRVILCIGFLGIFGLVSTAVSPKIRVRPKQASAPPPSAVETLNLPSNATSIRAEITDSFSCENRTYGYYADVANDCQIFHVCLPVTYADGKERTFRWSFICPEETQFNQENFTCARPEDSIECSESENFYDLNGNFGQSQTEETPGDEENSTDSSISPEKSPGEPAGRRKPDVRRRKG
ncbi:U-scoloptoxin(01)-Cw1a [Chrysoperla carnea]|uniref:U-scoloptoxin(01)-Cw1a n=1 Tax=Chrysoperla carnea TaxID=189513 RepID=UPI001D0631F5|nr:U-scoloptoxin(01)-Cw1a [Chrysoperla carnea]